ncbi:trimeric intracellular cation channel family protein [Halanaerobium sp. ST460_2HS_T2]|uniref:trimeric intracellular cation channel family protein n=1 Tax=Halanaerobium sp. ST460_2HS_T2 TaxID=2183914 RepID=UPI000DF4A5BA|nr:trimeric intracellular cation channel family protein [Halanaerobium sp. ST460_2HS_T2]RCW52382.1 putative membrane protein YeiH [Halanaerobium sp. ST460_2HS_T2]
MVFISVVDIIGTIAFAMSGALRAIEKEMDYYGIAVFGITTAVAGGTIRDILINKELPVSLANPIYLIISIFSAFLVIVFYKKIIRFNQILNIFDAVGLAAFTAIGSEVAVNNGYTQPFIIIVLAVMTGTGGGTLRDLFANEIPYVFHKEIYAVASVIGAVFFVITYQVFGTGAALYTAFVVTLLIRLFCMKKDIHLKKVSKAAKLKK